MGSVLPAQLREVREEGLYILNTVDNYETERDRHGKRREIEREGERERKSG